MQEVGRVSHLAGSGRVIVKLSREVPEGGILYDSKSARIARVMELIGPVKSPYASAAPLTNNTRRLAGRRLYAEAPR